jgi:tRNA 5-methylaminomethyl-2-thiouridine biosynthesis bifunctional protein
MSANKTSSNAQINTANIGWNQDGHPISTQYDDVYFSKESGIDETRFVFIDNNHLTERWQSLPQDQSGFFTIAETGFGTGLNFLTAVDEWLRSSPAHWQLHFISVEKYPLCKADLQKALALWPQLSDLSAELESHYPSQIAGFHRLNLFNNRVKLTLLFGEAATMFQHLKGTDHPLFTRTANPKIDAWFLDGFAPSKNPDMWSDELFQVIAELSDTGSTFATFTAAGVVRRGLHSAGFDVEKVKGFGRKREMARGIMSVLPINQHPTEHFEPNSRNSPYNAPWHINEHAPATQQQSAIVIGGGIAGCTTARALAERGWQVTIIDRHAKLAQEASGNPQGITYPKLSKQDSALSRYGLYSLMYCARYYTTLWDQKSGFGEQCGVLIMPESDKHAAELKIIGQRFAQQPELATLVKKSHLKMVSGIELDADHALFHPNLGWLDAGKTCRELANHPNIKHQKNTVAKIDWNDQTSWKLLTDSGDVIGNSKILIIASAMNTTQFKQTNHLPLKPIRGQVTVLKSDNHSEPLKTVVCGAGYASPATNGEHTIGSTYNLNDNCTDVRPEDNLINVDKMAKTDAGLGRVLHRELPIVRGRTAFRCTTPDYLPVVGPAPDEQAMRQRFALLAKNAKSHIPRTGNYYPGLYINCGYGSRGLSYAPLAAELLAAQITGEELPIEQELASALNPARFIIRNLKRGK